MNAFLKLQQTKDVLYGREKNRLKAPEQTISVFTVHVILFRIHERYAATEKEFDTVIQMKIEQSSEVLNG